MFRANQTKGFNVYLDGSTLIGVANIKLPDINFMAEKMSGAGVLGEVDTPSEGITESMELEVKFTSVISSMFTLMDIKGKSLEFWGSIAGYDTASGGMDEQDCRIVVRGAPKKVSLGTLEVNKNMDSSFTIECISLKITSNNTTLFECDKLNNVFTLLGKDLLSKYKENLGIGASASSALGSAGNKLKSLIGV